MSYEALSEESDFNEAPDLEAMSQKMLVGESQRLDTHRISLLLRLT